MKRRTTNLDLLRLLVFPVIAAVIVGCASTLHGKLKVEELSDGQLIEELASSEKELGMQLNREMALQAIDTSPRMVVTGATTQYSGSFNGQYNSANRSLHGNFSGNGYTTYHYVDANAEARIGQAIGLMISHLNQSKLESRRAAVLAELDRRHKEREQRERITTQFFAAHPELAARQDLLIACLLITQHRTNDYLEQLQQAAEVIKTLPENRWIGWVEAHGIPGYPYGVVVGSYFMDTVWDGENLSGNGRASDGSEMNLKAVRQGDGLIRGRISSTSMAAEFSGKMNEYGLCVDYAGTESGQSIRGITWAFRKG
ncbi:MAG: hypothetical protein IT581_15620 [Verrucomicrobiales bacterium]|nr:hypothetical protein [Verrucomicrobiales bacterium]